MKKIITVIALGLCLASLVGCSSSNQSAPASNSQQEQQSTQLQSSQTFSKDGQGYRRGQGPFENQELFSLLKTDSNTLHSELKSGKSLADIAQEKGVQEQQVIDLLVKQSQQKTDEAIKSGKLTQDKADQMKAKEQDRIKQEVEHKGGFGGRNGQRNQQHRQKNGDKPSGGSNNE